jgi:plasmid stability protein
MASLQIRDLPEAVHRQLQLRARRHHRSLAQQALCDLQAALGGDRRERRQMALGRLQAFWADRPSVAWPASVEELVRADRER